MRQQFMERMSLRSQEWAAHGPPPYSPADWADMSMASMRWGLQECGHTLQDLMSAALTWRGEWNGDQSAARIPGSALPETLAQGVDVFQQLMALQTKTWADCLNKAARQRKT
jgi:hypothetical protein